MYLATTPDGNALLEHDGLALLIGMLLDQQVPMEKAFTSPYVLRERMGRELDAVEIAEYDPAAFEELFRTPPALHRFPAAMAKRVQAMARVLVERLRRARRGRLDRRPPTARTWCAGSAGCPASASRRRRSSPRCSASSTASPARLARGGRRLRRAGSHRSVADVVDDAS